MSEHKDAVYFDETQPADNKTKAAYRELRLWQQGYIAAVEGGPPTPNRRADEFVLDVNAKRAQLLAMSHDGAYRTVIPLPAGT